MSAGDPARLGDLFARIADLEPAEREVELAALDPADAAALRRLLAHEDTGTDPIAAAIAGVGAAPSIAALPDARIGPWRILGEIGAGGMGTVFLAERAEGQFAQRAALKLIRGFPTEDGRRRLRLERQILAGLDHPNIARLLDGGETADGQPWIAMEHVDGEGLIEHVAHGGLGLDARLGLFDRIAAAVAHAHQRLVVHRDLKPGNVLVRADGEPRLLDFGIAKLLDVGLEPGSDAPSTRVWTPGYASPEQRAGTTITTASDVYGLGVMLREMLTGSRGGDDARPPPEGFQPIELDADLRGLIAMATAEQPSRRYPSVEALREDVGRYRSRRPLRARPDTRWYRAGKFVARHRPGVAMAAVALLVGGAFVWRLEAERSRAVAAEAIAAARGESARRAADSARGALGFVVALFQDAHPERTLGREVTPRTLVDDARRRLDADASLTPGMGRTLALTLGEIYHGLGESRIALDLYRRALEGPEPATADEVHELVRIHEGISIASLNLGSGSEAAAASIAAAELLDREMPDDPYARLRASAMRIYAADQRGDTDYVLEHAPALLAAADTASGFSVEDRVGVLLRLTEALKRAGRLDDALAASKRMLALLDANYAPLDPMRIRLRRTHAGVLGAIGRYAEAESTLREAIANYRRVAGGDGQQVASLLNDLSILLNDAGRPIEALGALEESRAIQARVAGEGAPVDAIGLQNLGSLLESVGDYAGAISTMSEAASLIRTQFPEGSPSVLKADANLARALAFAGRHAEARTLFERVRAAHAAAGEASRFDWAIETFRQAAAERLAGRYDVSARLMTECEPVFRGAVPEDHPLMAQFHRQQGLLAAARGDLAAARVDLERARGIIERAGLPELDLALVDASLAAIARDAGDPVRARQLLATALPVLRTTVGPNEHYRAQAERLDAGLAASDHPAR